MIDLLYCAVYLKCLTSYFMYIISNPSQSICTLDLKYTEESDEEEMNIEYVEDLDEEDEEDLEQDMEGTIRFMIVIYELFR